MSSTLLRTALARLLSFLVLGASAPAVACNAEGKGLQQLTGRELLEVFQRSDCRAESDGFAAALDERLDSGELPADLDARDIRFLRFRLRVDALRRSLQQADRSAIDAALFRLDEYAARLRAQIASSAHSDDTFSDFTHLLQQIEQIAEPIRAIVDGKTAPPPPTPFAPMPGWTLGFGCRSSLIYIVHYADRDPGSEDAWAAVAREEIAVQHLLQTQWMNAMNEGVAPPRLREFAERMLGAPGYEREVDAALAGIRIDTLPTGRTAFIPLLGHWLPLPLALGSRLREQAVVFQTPDDIAHWLRPMLLAQRAR